MNSGLYIVLVTFAVCFAIAHRLVLFNPLAIRVFDKLGLLTGVVLQDFEDREYISYARSDHFGGKVAYNYPISKVGHSILSPDFTVPSSYIKRWKYLTKPAE